jgi:hypothetical protein
LLKNQEMMITPTAVKARWTNRRRHAHLRWHPLLAFAVRLR